MNLFRGLLLIAAGIFVIYRGWIIQTHQLPLAHHTAWPFYGIGVIAIGLGLWRILRNPAKPRWYK